MALITSWFSQYIAAENLTNYHALQVDTQTGSRIVSPTTFAGDVLNPLSLASDGSTLLVPGGTTVRMWNVVDNQWYVFSRQGYGTTFVCHDWDRPLFAVVVGGTADLYEFSDGQPSRLSSAPAEAFISVRDFTCQNGTMCTAVVTSGGEGGLYATELETGAQTQPVVFAPGFDYRCVLAIDATRVAYAVGNTFRIQDGANVVHEWVAGLFPERGATISQDRTLLYVQVGDQSRIISLDDYTYSQGSIGSAPNNTAITGFVGSDVLVFADDRKAVTVPGGAPVSTAGWWPTATDNGGLFPGNVRVLLPRDGAGSRPVYLFWTRLRACVEGNVVAAPVPDPEPDPEPEPQPGEVGPFVFELAAALGENGLVGFAPSAAGSSLTPDSLVVVGRELRFTEVYYDAEFPSLLVAFDWDDYVPISHLRVYVNGTQRMDTRVTEGETMVGASADAPLFAAGQQYTLTMYVVPVDPQ